MSGNQFISNHTKRNWKRLGTGGNPDKLTSRANRLQSDKRRVHTEYFTSPAQKRAFTKAVDLLQNSFSDHQEQICAAAAAFTALFPSSPGGQEAERVVNTWHNNLNLEQNQQRHKALVKILEPLVSEIPDLLGALYQSLRSEGSRSRNGAYFTPDSIAKEAVGKCISGLHKGTVIDPACGTGQLLLQIRKQAPGINLIGVDIDPVCTRLAAVQLAVASGEPAGEARFFTADFLDPVTWPLELTEALDSGVSAAVTNPPWGARYGKSRKKAYLQLHPECVTGESATLFTNALLKILPENSGWSLILPRSLFTTARHTDARRLFAYGTRTEGVILPEEKFTQVMSGPMILWGRTGVPQRTIPVYRGTQQKAVHIPADYAAGADGFSPDLSSQELKSLEIMDKNGEKILESGVQWMLGIVTGDNKRHLQDAPFQDSEPVVRGRDVSPFAISESRCFIHFNPDLLQQCADPELYRSREKIIYRFVSSKPVAAVDREGRLILNSANAFIPDRGEWTADRITAYLNSTVAAWFFQKRWSDRKVLRRHLEHLPFPKLHEESFNNLDGHINTGDYSGADSLFAQAFGVKISL